MPSGLSEDIKDRSAQEAQSESQNNKPLELPKSPEQAKKLVEQLKQKEVNHDVANVSKEAFAKKIGEIRKMSIDEIKKAENATILQTYAVLHMGATEEQIGGIDGKFGPKTLAIFRKCQEDGVGGKGIKGVNQAELGKVAWGTTTESAPQKPGTAQPETSAAEATTAAGAATEALDQGRLSQEKTNEIWNSAIEEASQYAKEKGFDGIIFDTGKWNGTEMYAKGGFDISKVDINTIQAHYIFLKKGNEEIEIGSLIPEKTHLGDIMPSEEIVARIKTMIDQESNKVVLTAKSTIIE